MTKRRSGERRSPPAQETARLRATCRTGGSVTLPASAPAEEPTKPEESSDAEEA